MLLRTEKTRTVHASTEWMREASSDGCVEYSQVPQPSASAKLLELASRSALPLALVARAVAKDRQLVGHSANPPASVVNESLKAVLQRLAVPEPVDALLRRDLVDSGSVGRYAAVEE